jgi:hypothetical protein
MVTMYNGHVLPQPPSELGESIVNVPGAIQTKSSVTALGRVIVWFFPSV